MTEVFYCLAGLATKMILFRKVVKSPLFMLMTAGPRTDEFMLRTGRQRPDATALSWQDCLLHVGLGLPAKLSNTV